MSSVAEIIGISHCTWLYLILFMDNRLWAKALGVYLPFVPKMVSDCVKTIIRKQSSLKNGQKVFEHFIKEGLWMASGKKHRKNLSISSHYGNAY
jgi:hypothetical protein